MRKFTSITGKQYRVTACEPKKLMKRSKAKFKHFPQWVTNHYDKQELTDGFMIGREFYRPIYNIVVNGRYIPIDLNFKGASIHLHELANEFLPMGARFDLALVGFHVITQGEFTNDK